jgi:hypothetical protein
MSHPQLPPYLGSWEELVNALLHNPTLGSGAGGPHRMAQRQSAFTDFPNPDDTSVSHHHPPRPNEFTSVLLAQLSLRQAAARLPKEQGNDVMARIDQTVADEIDFICGNGIPILWLNPPGPPPPNWMYSVVVSELVLIANTLQTGGLRSDVERVAGSLLEAGLKNAQVAPARVQERKVAA